MRLITLFLVCLFTCSIADAGDNKTFIFPVAYESPRQDQIDEQKQIDESLIIGLGLYPLKKHLIDDHKCPESVVDAYKDDLPMLMRIHEGYKLLEQIKQDQKSLNRYSWHPQVSASLERDISKAKSRFKLVEMKIADGESSEKLTIESAREKVFNARNLGYDPEAYIRDVEPNCNDIRKWQIRNGVNMEHRGQYLNRRVREIRCEPPEAKL